MSVAATTMEVAINQTIMITVMDARSHSLAAEDDYGVRNLTGEVTLGFTPGKGGNGKNPDAHEVGWLQTSIYEAQNM
ncbi:hypothetical protein DEO72_LG11g1809 [Vigna unguiculata]|uniref:Uncharacterized protein n=1 Tax=Vigna unguiculata TaxID=3917 RepID=A0A4D6NLW2_VIGUN|nr:hypothetical protein DEO72_LG11g1809 [Vigna unguiculata]